MSCVTTAAPTCCSAWSASTPRRRHLHRILGEAVEAGGGRPRHCTTRQPRPARRTIAAMTTTTKRVVALADEWFCSPAWDEAARADFEARLGRARPGNRQQYLRITGVSLRAAGNLDAARALLKRAAECPDAHLFMTVAAWETLGGHGRRSRRAGDRRTARPAHPHRAAQTDRASSTACQVSGFGLTSRRARASRSTSVATMIATPAISVTRPAR
jgi:hypothetical protein